MEWQGISIALTAAVLLLQLGRWAGNRDAASKTAEKVGGDLSALRADILDRLSTKVHEHDLDALRERVKTVEQELLRQRDSDHAIRSDLQKLAVDLAKVNRGEKR